jgi:glycosyltransferase involved in cell wall biosynthesis
MRVAYFYPMHHEVSFRYVAEQHVRFLSERFAVDPVDERALVGFSPAQGTAVVLHPLLYLAGKSLDGYMHLVSRAERVIGVDVADSDRVSVYAVTIANLTDALIVPSTFSKRAYVESGVRIPVHVVPHALDDAFLAQDPPQDYINELGEYIPLLSKLREKYWVLFFYSLWHSDYRKGADLVFETLSQLSKEREDFALVARTSSPIFLYEAEKRGIRTLAITKHLFHASMRYLYDLCDIYPLFSRGGGFELNGLEALARGEIVIASEGGAWEEYLPREFLVPSRAWVRVFRDNPYHTGLGPEIDVEKAVDRLHEVMDNLGEWRARAGEHSVKIRELYSPSRVKSILISAFEGILSV